VYWTSVVFSLSSTGARSTTRCWTSTVSARREVAFGEPETAGNGRGVAEGDTEALEGVEVIRAGDRGGDAGVAEAFQPVAPGAPPVASLELESTEGEVIHAEHAQRIEPFRGRRGRVGAGGGESVGVLDTRGEAAKGFVQGTRGLEDAAGLFLADREGPEGVGGIGKSVGPPRDGAGEVGERGFQGEIVEPEREQVIGALDLDGVPEREPLFAFVRRRLERGADCRGGSARVAATSAVTAKAAMASLVRFRRRRVRATLP
jgi:hypothetical protein